MAEASQTVPILVTLMPALVGLAGTVIGAVIGFGSTLLTQRSLSRLNKEADERKQEVEKKNKKAEKLEESVVSLYEYQHWLLREVRPLLEKGETIQLPRSPIAKVQAISYVYFPEFRGSIDELAKIEYQYQFSVVEGGEIPHLNPDDTIGTIRTGGVYYKYISQFNSLLDLIIDRAAKLQ